MVSLDPRLTGELDRLLVRLAAVVEVVYVRRPLEGVLDDDDVTAAQLRTLRLLAGQPAHTPILIGEISEGLRISYPAASKAVDRLVDRGLAERQRDARDARQTLVCLTSKGQEVVSKVAELRLARLAQVLLELGGEQPTQALIGLLEAFVRLSTDPALLETNWLMELEREVGHLG